MMLLPQQMQKRHLTDSNQKRDIALVDDEVKELPHLIALSKRMMITIKLNMTFSMGLNFLAIATSSERR